VGTGLLVGKERSGGEEVGWKEEGPVKGIGAGAGGAAMEGGRAPTFPITGSSSPNNERSSSGKGARKQGSGERHFVREGMQVLHKYCKHGPRVLLYLKIDRPSRWLSPLRQEWEEQGEAVADPVSLASPPTMEHLGAGFHLSRIAAARRCR